MGEIILGVIRVRDVFINRCIYQPRPSNDYILKLEGDKYIFRGKDVGNDEHRQQIMYTFWADNAAHASYGMKFLDDIIEDHKSGVPWRRLKGSLQSCGEKLEVMFIPWDLIKDEIHAKEQKEREAKKKQEEEERIKQLEKQENERIYRQKQSEHNKIVDRLMTSIEGKGYKFF